MLAGALERMTDMQALNLVRGGRGGHGDGMAIGIGEGGGREPLFPPVCLPLCHLLYCGAPIPPFPLVPA